MSVHGMHGYLGFSGAQDINHHLHDGLVHTQCPHQVRVLVEHFIFHDITTEKRILVPRGSLVWVSLTVFDITCLLPKSSDHEFLFFYAHSSCK